MGPQAAAFAVLLGLSVLAIARADNHEHACLTSVIDKCNLTGSYAEAKEIEGPIETGGVSEEKLKAYCSNWKQTLDCVKMAIKGCNSTEVAEMKKSNMSLASFDYVEGWARSGCNKGTYCDLKFMKCGMDESDFTAYGEKLKNGTAAFNTSYCEAGMRFAGCVKKFPGHCRTKKPVRETAKDMMDFKDHCDEASCSVLTGCRKAFNDGGPKQSGLDDKTCGLYKTFASCTANITSDNCPTIKLRNKISGTKVAEYLTTACGAMKDHVAALYECQTFTDCVDMALNPVKIDITSPQNLCKTFQSVVTCALKNAPMCSGINNESLATFMTAAKKLSMDAAQAGCGMPKIYVPEDCAQVKQCRADHDTKNPGNVGALCKRQATFQKCSSEAMEACKDKVMKPMRPGKPRPDLKKLSKFSDKVCKAIDEGDGAKFKNCEMFNNCVSGMAGIDDMTVDPLSPDTWCGTNTQMLECARMYREGCGVANSMVTKVDDLYNEVIKDGCPNTFDFLVSEPDTSGAESSSLGAQFYFLLLALSVTLLNFVST